MKILLTGCAGFIGSHCCERLLSLGHEVVGIDNFSLFYNKQIKLNNLEGFIHHPKFSFHELDIRDQEAIQNTITDKVDLVVHLAAKAGVWPSIQDPTAYIDVNVKGTHNLLQWMVAKDCKKLFFASSSSVYGNNPDGQSVKEEDITNEPISPYAFTKKSGELLNYTYHHLYKIDVVNARFFTVYGPRQRPDLAIYKFVNLIEQKKQIEIYGDGSTARDYTYVDDTVEGIVKSIDFLMSKDGFIETFNFGNQKPIPLKRLVEIIFEKTGAKTPLNFMEVQAGDVNLTYANIEKAKRLIGYEPAVSIEEGIERFYQWFKTKRN